MSYFDKKIEKKILNYSYNYFPTHTNMNGNITKIVNEPYSYWVDETKMYIFEKDELFNFLTWYWYNNKDTFFFDLVDLDYDETVWKYFCNKIPNFKINYPTDESYYTSIIENTNGVEIFDNLINIVGLDNFINDVLIKKNNYKVLNYNITKNIIYKFATHCGTQIFN